MLDRFSEENIIGNYCSQNIEKNGIKILKFFGEYNRILFLDILKISIPFESFKIICGREGVQEGVLG
ncbi:unnamed protein product [Meloidogyne enterolobii]|uniref:Uncharacterized protein n=1 Tax=Meloidogyne enterolobii TaxID=390850 RepID=A0ACB1AST1_MELEN